MCTSVSGESVNLNRCAGLELLKITPVCIVFYVQVEGERNNKQSHTYILLTKVYNSSLSESMNFRNDDTDLYHTRIIMWSRR